MRILLVISIALIHVMGASARDEVLFIGMKADETVTPTNKVIAVPDGEELQVSTYIFGKAYDWHSSGSDRRTNDLVNTFSIKYVREGFTIAGNTNRMIRLVGPAEVTLGFPPQMIGVDPSRQSYFSPNSGCAVYLSFVPAMHSPNRSVIIPAGSKGATITLESSYDLTSWVPAMPGTYTAPTNNLFFRLRLDRFDP